MVGFPEFRSRLPYDLVGVPPAEAFRGLPPGENPFELFPDARSVLVLGRRIRRGEFRSMEEGSRWNTPGRWLNDMDDAVRLIEEAGYECLPYLPQDSPLMPRRAVRPGGLAPNSSRLSIEYAAACAGLGEIGMHGLFMSRDFGIRQRLGLLVTDMEIEPGPLEDVSGICDGCLECVRGCPLQAISSEDGFDLTVNGRTTRLAAVNANACRHCPNGATPDRQHFAGAEELHFEVENNQEKGPAQGPAPRGGLPNRLSAACGRACLAHFESVNDTGYHIGYRNREPWGFRPDGPGPSRPAWHPLEAAMRKED